MGLKIYIGDFINWVQLNGGEVIFHCDNGFNPQEKRLPIEDWLIQSKIKYDFETNSCDSWRRKTPRFNLSEIDFDFDFKPRYAETLLNYCDEVFDRKGLAGFVKWANKYPKILGEVGYIKRIANYLENLNSRGANERTFGIPIKDVLKNVPLDNPPPTT